MLPHRRIKKNSEMHFASIIYWYKYGLNDLSIDTIIGLSYFTPIILTPKVVHSTRYLNIQNKYFRADFVIIVQISNTIDFLLIEF
jgi:hypothetical protein